MCVCVCVCVCLGVGGGEGMERESFQNKGICDGNLALSRRILHQMTLLKTERKHSEGLTKEVSEGADVNIISHTKGT